MSISKQELMNHIYTNKDRPNAIPFEFKYYEQDWGFCVQHEKLKEFIYDQYKVVIKTSFEKGEIKIGELVLSGESQETIVLVAHLCHPAMANDDLSGVAVLVNIANSLSKRKHRHYSYRILFLPETIGSIAYLSQNEDLISSIKFGIFFEMLGNDNVHALQLSRQGNTIIDMAARNVMKNSLSQFNEGPFREIISNDEMVFNGPGVNIPMISISRWPYPEYHTSDDNISIIKSEKLEESRDLILKIIDLLERNYTPKRKFRGPPFLSKYGLWIDWRVNPKLNLMMEKLFLEFEGDKSIIEIAELLDLNFEDVYNYVNKFVDADLVEKL